MPRPSGQSRSIPAAMRCGLQTRRGSGRQPAAGAPSRPFRSGGSRCRQGRRSAWRGRSSEALNSQPLLLGDAGGQTEAIDGTSNPDTGGVDGHLSVDVALDLLDVHVGGVLGISRDAMVLLDDGVEDLGEVLVAIPVSGVDAAVLVVELDGALAARLEGASRGGGGDVLQLVPLLLGHVLGDQGVGGQDGGEFAGHDVTLWASCRSESSNKSLALQFV